MQRKIRSRAPFPLFICAYDHNWNVKLLLKTESAALRFHPMHPLDRRPTSTIIDISSSTACAGIRAHLCIDNPYVMYIYVYYLYVRVYIWMRVRHYISALFPRVFFLRLQFCEDVNRRIKKCLSEFSIRIATVLHKHFPRDVSHVCVRGNSELSWYIVQFCNIKFDTLYKWIVMLS